MYQYRAEVQRVVDGDTIHARVDLGCDCRIDLTLRLYGINAPEMHTPTTAEGKAAREHLVILLGGEGSFVTIDTHKDSREKYGRYLATIYVDTPSGVMNVNAQMVADGFAVEYLL